MEIREAVSFYHLRVKYVMSVKFELSCTVASSAGTTVHFQHLRVLLLKQTNVCFTWFAQLIIEIVKIIF